MDVVVPDAVRAAAADLGELRQHRREVAPSMYWRHIAVIGVAAAGGEALGIALVSQSSELWLTFVLLAMMLGGLGYAGYMIMVVLRRARTIGAVDLYEFEHGLVRLTLRDLTVFPWRTSAVWEIVYRESGAQGSGSVRRSFSLRRLDHNGLTEPLPLAAELDRISALVTEATLPDALAAARSTGATFGAMTLGPDGITVDATTTPWMRIDRVVREFDEIRVYRRGEAGPWVGRPIGQVPGAPVMLATAERMLADAGLS